MSARLRRFAASDIPREVDLASGSMVGQILDGRYLLHSLIGRGGVGVVYLATDLETSIEVVVKLLGREWLADSTAVARFEREAQRLRSLNHPNIVQMYDHGHDKNRAFLVMQHVVGRPLDEFVREHHRLSLIQFVPIAAQVLKAIGHTHAREIVVRDIKPSNVMLCERQGRANYVIVLDFGLAKHLRAETPITREHVMGTAGYLAPESLMQQPQGRGVDVYALGVMFWTMLTGGPPFPAKNDAVVFFRTVHDPVPSLRAALPDDSDVPDALVALIESCLAKSPDQRPPDANALVEKLIASVPSDLFRLPKSSSTELVVPHHADAGVTQLAGHTPNEGSRPGLATRRGRTSRRAGALLGVTALLAMGGYAGVVGLRANPDPPAAVTDDVASPDGDGRAPHSDVVQTPSEVEPTQARSATTVDPTVPAAEVDPRVTVDEADEPKAVARPTRTRRARRPRTRPEPRAASSAPNNAQASTTKPDPPAAMLKPSAAPRTPVFLSVESGDDDRGLMRAD